MGLRDFVSIIRELSLSDIAEEASIAPTILVLAHNQETAEALRDKLFGRGSDRYVDVRTQVDSGIDPLRYDVIVSLGPLESTTAREWSQLFNRVNERMRMVEVSLVHAQQPGRLESVRRRIADAADERSLAIGRYIPAMQAAAVTQVVTETSMVNAQFALVSNVPAVVPIVGTLVAVGADFIVLTKNQLLMIYKLAAIYGRDLDRQWRIYSEMIPVVGAGLVWRTIAREVSAMLPLAIGTVPKVAIAFAGTWATGKAAQVYYEQGEKLNAEQFRGLYAEALELLKRQPISLPARRRGGDVEEKPVAAISPPAESSLIRD